MAWRFAVMFFGTTVRTETRRSANLGVTHVPGLPNLGEDYFIYTTVNFREFYAKMPNASWMSLFG